MSKEPGLYLESGKTIAVDGEINCRVCNTTEFVTDGSKVPKADLIGVGKLARKSKFYCQTCRLFFNPHL